MVGRGRGRFPRTHYSDPNLPVINQPPPVYPALEFKPVPLLGGQKIEYLLTLKQEIRSSFKESGYYIPPVSVRKDIERYTDKYQPVHAADQIIWDKTLFPKELFERPKKNKKETKSSPVKEVAIAEKLKVLEEKEEKDVEKGPEEEEEEEVEEMEEEFVNEEYEEDNDYQTNYFDNGENYLNDEDDNLDDNYE